MAQESLEPIEIMDSLAMWHLIDYKGKKGKLYSLTARGFSRLENAVDQKEVAEFKSKFNSLIDILSDIIKEQMKSKIVTFFSTGKKYRIYDAQISMGGINQFYWQFNQAFKELKQEGKIRDVGKGRYQIV